MIGVAIIGVLAAVAVPAYMRYVRKAKTAEATENIQKMYESSKGYIFEANQARGEASPLIPQFPDSQAITPEDECCDAAAGIEKCTPAPDDWQTATWAALHFGMDDPFFYQYEYVSTGTDGAGVGSRFTARAVGNLDCDDVSPTFEMFGEWTEADHDVHGSGGIYRENPLE